MIFLRCLCDSEEPAEPNERLTVNAISVSHTSSNKSCISNRIKLIIQHTKHLRGDLTAFANPPRLCHGNNAASADSLQECLRLTYEKGQCS